MEPQQRSASGPFFSEDSRGGLERPVVLLLFAVYVAEVLRNAWIGADAFITLRTVDNFVHGQGLGFNVQERVQAYTHPLWMGLVSFFYSWTRESYLTVLAISVACSVAAAFVAAFRLAATRLEGILALVLFITSIAFVDYSTSGLENPLTHLLLGGFALLYARGVDDGRSLALLALTAGLGLVNRMDTALLFLPGLLHAAWRSLRWRAAGPLALGLAPFFLWEAFSVFYYGFPFPNTAYAKLGAGVPRSELIEQGIYYYIDSLYRDPVTLIVIFAAFAALVARGRKSDLVLFSGVGLYLAYLVWIGGDFMSGRFFSAPYYMAVVLLVAAPLSRTSFLALTAVAVLLAFGAQNSDQARSASQRYRTTGIVDEKSVRFHRLGLPEVHRDAPVRQSRPDRSKGKIEVWVDVAVGFEEYLRGPRYHIIDTLGLTDPLLARLPTDRVDWRIGHFTRRLPAGYLATLRSGSNQIEDRALAAYYDRLSLVVRGDLFDGARWRTIAAFSLGRYDGLIDRESYRRPYNVEIPLEDVLRVKREGARWDAPSNVILPPHNGVLIRFAEVSHCSRLRLGLAGRVSYRLVYYRAGEPVPYYERGDVVRNFRQSIPRVRKGGIRASSVEVPPDVAREGYDALMIEPVGSNFGERHSVGYVQLCGARRAGPPPEPEPPG